MPFESDPVFIKRILAVLDAHAAGNQGADPPKVTLDQEDVLRMVKLYAGLPPTAMRVN